MHSYCDPITGTHSPLAHFVKLNMSSKNFVKKIIKKFDKKIRQKICQIIRQKNCQYTTGTKKNSETKELKCRGKKIE